MRIDRALVIAVVALLLTLSVQLVLPYLQFVLAALLLAFVLKPAHNRLSSYLGRAIAALVVTVVATVAIVFPFLVVAALVSEEAVAYVQYLQDREFGFARVERLVAEYTGQQVNFESILLARGENAVTSVFGGALSLVGTAAHVLIGVAVLLFLLYYFVKDGDRFVTWLADVSPLPEPVLDDLVTRIDAITRAVLVGHVLVAFVQGVVAGLGLAVVGIQNVVFWTFVMVLLGLIPIVGSFVVWGGAAAWLVVQGAPLGGVGLFLYGLVVVGLTDDVLRPLVVDRYARVNPTLILIGVVGGLAVWGFMGLFVGPIVIGALRETIEIYADHYGTAHTASR